MKLRNLTKRFDWYTKVKFDKKIGFFYYHLHGQRMYIRHPRHYVAAKELDWICENILYRHYMPRQGDQVVDFGLGYGAEALYLADVSPGVRYLGIEPQPMLYELACNTLAQLGPDYQVSPFVVTDLPRMHFSSALGYGAVGADETGCVEVSTMPWPAFKARCGLGRIDLLKINIEGAERPLLEHIEDFSEIRRLVVSCHDFRADHGHGEYFRTKAYVTERLSALGYTLKFFDFSINWADGYVYAERSD
jgi:hypothetical protein